MNSTRRTNRERSKLDIKLAAAKRYLLWQYFPEKLDLLRVTEFPKSGGSWLSKMIAEVTDIHFPQYYAPPFKRCLLQGHHLPRKDEYKMVAVMRDGRDVMVSYYYHLLVGNDKITSYSVNKWRSKLPFEDYTDTKKNMPKFIEFMFNEYPKFGKFSWSDFANAIFQNDTFYVKYEDMLVTPALQLKNVLQHLGENVDEERIQQIVDKNSFEKLSKRKRGKENTGNFMRKGIAGDWKNHFSPEAIEVFNSFAAKEMSKLNYY